MDNSTLLKKAAAAIQAQKHSIVPQLANLLIERQPQWYTDANFNELSDHLSTFVERICSCMNENTLTPLETFFKSSALEKVERGFQLSDILEGVMLGKFCLSLAILKEIPLGKERKDILTAVDLLYVDLNKITGEKYSALLTQQLVIEHERTKLLLEATRSITNFADSQAALEHLARVISETLSQGICIIFLRDSVTQGLAPHATYGHVSEECKRCFDGVRLCPEGNTITTTDGKSFGLCALNSESFAMAQDILELINSNSIALFPIYSSSNCLHGIAMVGSVIPDYVIGPNQKELIEGILHTVSATVELAASVKEKERQLKESESLRRVANLLLQHPETQIQDVHTVICDEARSIVQGTGSSILLKEGDNLHHSCGTGSPQPPISTFPLATTKYGQILQEGKAVIIRDAQQEIPEGQRSDLAKTLLVVPLIECGNAIGLLLISNKESGFDLIDKNIMELFAAQASMALRNATLAKQSDKLAVAEERQRLGRELHDSVTQALYAVTLCADAASRSLSLGKKETATEQLQALRGMAQQAMRDMRSLIFDLHPPELENEGLVGAIQARMNSVEIRSGLNAKMFVKGEERRLAHSTEEEMFRIAIEALSNATKHSHAQNVSVTFDYKPESVSMTITDDGKGFVINRLPAGGMGLRNIRERAKRLQATLEINSNNDDGTTIDVSVPLTR
ncbi:sensor histidine kinase [Halodesulfovibrio marinisediminis]|uniref:Histidine kinase-, DNA gyrase B-, and HSP90-like ATPase n=1 Tax=Halodesulfovibrio marinisediminis DSM 17456 TaxID=1121457 RepID=A0A1N6GZ15_9BACT|nr:GAF domain-containing sensor histidine kinase [Halodesulfovibrio marinisediminis]SIO12736.1 Histidine kinase-, DNA gyrase B-, and HSP90-like ATPase [Halodesulfovibrio marinisediminis DSM 17456]